jgi:manganese/zinc/iron transport system permease protein
MLIAPAVAARQLTHRVGSMLVIAGGIGLLSGFLGNYMSVEFPGWFDLPRLTLPTGPIIVLVAAFFCLLALLLAPERGFLGKIWRRFSFRARCLEENVLKTIWRGGGVVSLTTLMRWQEISPLRMRFLLWRLQRKGWAAAEESGYALTVAGKKEGARIIRLHRLWEVYLTECLGVSREKVHSSAEEMDHVLTDELEKELTQLLDDPKRDPHRQPIPSRSEVEGR